jgi:hypothetical protein
MDTTAELKAARSGRPARRHLAYTFVGALLLSALLLALLANPALALTVRGGTDAQRAYVTRVIKECSLDYATTETELRAFGPVTVDLVKLDGQTGYSEMGHIYINSDIPVGEILGEMAAHEWAHQIWYSLGPKWWQKWAALAGAGPVSAGGPWRQDPAENFAECGKVALWSGEAFLRNYAVTDLKVIGPQDFRDWLAQARYVKNCPFTDLSPSAMPSTSDQDELAAAGAYVQAKGLMQGFSGTVFGSTASLTRQQLAQICERAGLSYPQDWRYDSDTATRGEVCQTIEGLTWTGERWSEPITRGQLARLLWRSR